MNLQELQKVIESWCNRLLFAQKVNTAVTGLGLGGIAVAMLVQVYVMSLFHETEMRLLARQYGGQIRTAPPLDENRDEMIQKTKSEKK